MVTDSQRLTSPVKWRKSAVMTDQWRLVNGAELFDMITDPEQRNDVAADHPSVVARLREGYEAWWAKVSQQFDEEIPIVIGDESPNSPKSVMLCSHDWRNENCDCVWNQCQVREGQLFNGYWEIDVAKAGTYRFELRRWPKEEELGLNQGIQGNLVSYGQMTLESGYGGGTALPISQARIQIGSHNQAQELTKSATEASFTLDLAAGPTHLRTTFRGEGTELGAYYVYIDHTG